MGFAHGSSAVLKVADSEGGTLQDISDALNESSSEESVDTAETTAFGDTAKAYIAGLEDGTISMSGHFNSSTGKVHDVLKDLKRKKVAFEYFPEGEASGSAKGSGDCILTSYAVSSSVSDKVSVSASFQVSGGVTWGSVA